MLELSGKANSARVMLDEIDATTRAQILSFLDCPAFGGSSIVVMPDCHAGKGAVIGLTMSLNEYIIPNIVGVDIGCGVLALPLAGYAAPHGSGLPDWAALDAFIRREVPAGFEIHRQDPAGIDPSFLEELDETARAAGADPARARRSLGTLGGGNHFIEVDRDPAGGLWLLVHSGSRNLGLRVAERFQERARAYHARGGRGHGGVAPARDLEWLPADHPDARAYLAAMGVAQRYAALNRARIAARVAGYLAERGAGAVAEGAAAGPAVESVHNYIDFRDRVLRKGAIAARAGERCVIPLTMRDGAAICVGLGNRDWNLSAPHGAGRRLSRHAARRELDAAAFRRSMREAGVFTTTAGAETLDEAPEAYKPVDLILGSLGPTVAVETPLRPLYNFKAAGD